MRGEDNHPKLGPSPSLPETRYQYVIVWLVLNTSQQELTASFFVTSKECYGNCIITCAPLDDARNNIVYTLLILQVNTSLIVKSIELWK